MAGALAPMLLKLVNHFPMVLNGSCGKEAQEMFTSLSSISMSSQGFGRHLRRAHPGKGTPSLMILWCVCVCVCVCVNSACMHVCIMNI